MLAKILEFWHWRNEPRLREVTFSMRLLSLTSSKSTTTVLNVAEDVAVHFTEELGQLWHHFSVWWKAKFPSTWTRRRDLLSKPMIWALILEAWCHVEHFKMCSFVYLIKAIDKNGSFAAFLLSSTPTWPEALSVVVYDFNHLIVCVFDQSAALKRLTRDPEALSMTIKLMQWKERRIKCSMAVKWVNKYFLVRC